jgi:hypothetical protein
VLIGAGYMARSKRVRRGVLPEHAAPTATQRNRRRKFSVTAGIFTGIVVNLVLAALCFGWYFSPRVAADEQAAMTDVFGQMNAQLTAAPDWLCPVLGSLLLLNVLLLVVVYFWQSWGVVGLVLIPIAAAVALANAGLGIGIALAGMLVLLLPVIPLIALLCSGPRPTMWEQMD